MRKYIKPGAIIAITLALTGSMAFAMQPQPQAEVKQTTKAEVKVEAPKEEVKVEEVAPAAPVEPTPVVTTPTPIPIAVAADNETTVWNFLTWKGFTREQIAGIMGNLQQEHNFQTDGDGLAQWTGGRKANLMNDPNWQDINVQLTYLMRELHGTEIAAYNAIKASTTVDDAVRAFQNNFERCGDCREGQRIQYAYAILGRH